MTTSIAWFGRRSIASTGAADAANASRKCVPGAHVSPGCILSPTGAARERTHAGSRAPSPAPLEANRAPATGRIHRRVRLRRRSVACSIARRSTAHLHCAFEWAHCASDGARVVTSERPAAVESRPPLCRPCGGTGIYGEGNCYYCRGVGRVTTATVEGRLARHPAVEKFERPIRWYCTLCGGAGNGHPGMLIEHCAEMHDGARWRIEGSTAVLAPQCEAAGAEGRCTFAIEHDGLHSWQLSATAALRVLADALGIKVTIEGEE